MNKHRWLLCTHHLLDYSGSEVVTLDLAEELVRTGHRVSIFSSFQNADFIRQAVPDNVTVLSDAGGVRAESFDIIYCHHQSTALFMATQDMNFLKSKDRPIFVFNHLSPFEPFEAPGPFVEEIFADIILCNSKETQSALSQFGKSFANASLFLNPAPIRFSTALRPRPERLKCILSISNHVPRELNEAFKILNDRGVKVVKIGRLSAQKRLEPSDFENCDAVVSIGKSVQYALRAKIPIFCYDKFGGPGWITEVNFGAASDQNFSGRCHPVKRSPSDLADEIINNVHTAKIFATPPDEYCLEVMVERLLEDIRALKGTRKPILIDSDELRYKLTRERSIYALVDREYGIKVSLALKKAAAEKANRGMRSEIQGLKSGFEASRRDRGRLQAWLANYIGYAFFMGCNAIGRLPVIPRHYRERFLKAASRRARKRRQ